MPLQALGAMARNTEMQGPTTFLAFLSAFLVSVFRIFLLRTGILELRKPVSQFIIEASGLCP